MPRKEFEIPVFGRVEIEEKQLNPVSPGFDTDRGNRPLAASEELRESTLAEKRGAWVYGPYKSPTRAWDDERLGAALIAIKKELAYVGYARESLVLDTPVFGEAAANSVKDFQEAQGLKVDGEVGEVTAVELFRTRVQRLEDRHSLGRGTLGKKIRLESNFDPVAIGGVDPRDRGMCQINLAVLGGFHNVSLLQAYDPAFAIPWAAQYLVANRAEIQRTLDPRIQKAMRASYNTGIVPAFRWMMAGFPASGGVFPEIHPTIDWYDRATKYLAAIDARKF